MYWDHVSIVKMVITIVKKTSKYAFRNNGKKQVVSISKKIKLII